ncbi:MAG TPA: hypothetical protein VHP38_12430 [Ruminiclostridium sp.]|nr:hypothetical protein [Ruminiclostridium sp.]
MINNMFYKSEKLFYIDIKDGLIQEGKFVDSDGSGIWILLKGNSLNTYVYFDTISERVFKGQSNAQTGLESIKSRMKDKLSKDDSYVNDLLERLKKSEGALYSSIIGEILHEKAGL